MEKQNCVRVHVYLQSQNNMFRKMYFDTGDSLLIWIKNMINTMPAIYCSLEVSIHGLLQYFFLAILEVLCQGRVII